MKKINMVLTSLIFISSIVCFSITYAENIKEKFESSRALEPFQRGLTYLQEKKFSESIDEFKKSLELFPNYYVTYSNLGYAYLYGGKPNEALDCFKKALVLKPDFMEAVRGMGNVYMNLKQEKEAAECFEKSIKMDPDSVPPYMALGVIYNNQKRYNEAIPLFKKVIESNPDLVAAYTNMSLSYSMVGDIEQGYKYMKEAQALAPNNMTINDLTNRLEAKLKQQSAAIQNIQDNSIIQEPRGDTMELVEFVPKKINLPFNIKYPAKWYTRETIENAPSLYITREPIRNIEDKYKVGVAAIYSEDYFIKREAPGTAFDKMAKAVLKAKNWDEDKKAFVQNLRQNGFTILAQSDVKISNQPALRIEYESKLARVLLLYIKLGKDLLMVFFEAPPTEYETYRNIFEQMISSFTIRDDFKIVDEGTIFEKVLQEQIAKSKTRK